MALEEQRIICVYCNKEFTPNMTAELEKLDAGCSTCGHDGYAIVCIDITCEHCNRVVYSKEIKAT